MGRNETRVIRLEEDYINNKKVVILKETLDKVFFFGGIFSNFHKVDGGFNYKGKYFETTEQAFMYAKALLFKDSYHASLILNSRTPKEAKSYGRKVRNFNEDVWEENRFELMKEINLIKYSKEPYKTELLKTKDKELVEASPYDRIWGIGLSVKEDTKELVNKRNWKGKNLLGKVLMEVREELKKD